METVPQLFPDLIYDHAFKLKPCLQGNKPKVPNSATLRCTTDFLKGQLLPHRYCVQAVSERSIYAAAKNVQPRAEI